MQIRFSISYGVQTGQRVAVVLDRTHAMSTPDGYHHELTINVEAPFTYHYAILDAAGRVVRREETSAVRTVSSPAGATLLLADCWQDRPTLRPESSAAFRLCRHPQATQDSLPTPTPGTYQFVLHAPLPARADHTYALAGSRPEFGAWQAAGALPMHRSAQDLWQVSVPVTMGGELEYKYVLLDTRGRHIVAWEGEGNRTARLHPNVACRLDDGRPRLEVERPRVAGMVIPLFSLRSDHSCGIGDFGDLSLLVDWAHSVGMGAIQLLPINDTTRAHTWRDSYPYNCVSVMALHPIYAQIDGLHTALTPDERADYEPRRAALNALPQVDYEEVERLKLSMLRKVYTRSFAHLSRTKAYRDFTRRNEAWLRPYAAFCYLRDLYRTADFRTWPRYKQYREAEVKTLLRAKDARTGVNFFIFAQFVLFMQMEQVHLAARRAGVLLKGDLPIGISRDSVPAWVDGPLFNFDGQAGAPPDAFAREGQNWGFPTYRWDVMARDDYAWWKQRLQLMQWSFDAYRIDHVLGFFRIWQIPYGRRDGLLGHFVPALPLSRAEWVQAGIDLPDAAIYRSRVELMKPADEVLAIEDDDRPEHFHPAIAARQSRPYKQLSDDERHAFDRVYDDYFYHRHNDFWAQGARQKLPALLSASNMLPCAEDLGMVPACVDPVLGELQILTLQIERMPKTYGLEFDETHRYPYMSVATAETHDMPPLRLWWSQNPEAAQRYYNGVLGLEGPAPRHMTASLAEAVVRRHLESPSMLCLLSFQDWTALLPATAGRHPEAEQINVPANPNQYWRYRMHLSLEQLAQATALNEKIRGLIAASGR